MNSSNFALWGQIRDHVGAVAGLEGLAEREKKLVSTDFLDDDLKEIFTRRPKSFAMSMFQSE